MISDRQHTRQHAAGPLVSIVTVVLNGEDGIRKTIESVAAQTYPYLEYIIIDGGSTDTTISIIEEYPDTVDRWYSEKDNGISDAFNKGIALCHGELVGIINAGDWYEQTTVEKIVDIFVNGQENPVDVICGDLQYWRGEERTYRCVSRPELLERDMSVTHMTCFVKKTVYDTRGGFDTAYRYAMDYELLLRFKKSGVDFYSTSDLLANMQHDGISEQNWRKALKETHLARKRLLSPSFFTSYYYYLFLVGKRGCRILLEKLGFDFFLTFYRENIALVKKTKI